MPRCELDHLVVAAASLEQGADWLEDKLGVRVPPGGSHPLMGTHNRLMQIGGGAFLEIIAIDPGAPEPGRRRWYGLDSPAMRERLAARPELLTWVVRTNDIAAAVEASPVPAGPIIEARRGTLVWQITVPHDGSMPEQGLFPTLIQWHDFSGPAANMADPGCRLEGFRIAHREPERLQKALAAIGADGIAEIEGATRDNPPGLKALIGSPKGVVEIS